MPLNCSKLVPNFRNLAPHAASTSHFYQYMHRIKGQLNINCDLILCMILALWQFWDSNSHFKIYNWGYACLSVFQTGRFQMSLQELESLFFCLHIKFVEFNQNIYIFDLFDVFNNWPLANVKTSFALSIGIPYLFFPSSR